MATSMHIHTTNELNSPTLIHGPRGSTPTRPTGPTDRLASFLRGHNHNYSPGRDPPTEPPEHQPPVHHHRRELGTHTGCRGPPCLTAAPARVPPPPPRPSSSLLSPTPLPAGAAAVAPSALLLVGASCGAAAGRGAGKRQSRQAARTAGAAARLEGRREKTTPRRSIRSGS